MSEPAPKSKESMMMDLDLDIDASWSFDQIFAAVSSNPTSPFLPCSPLWAFSDDNDEKNAVIISHPRFVACIEFCNVAKRIFICFSHDMKSFGAGTKSPSFESETTAST